MNLSITKGVSWVVAVFGGIILAIVLFGNHQAHPYTVYARFDDASDLLPNNFVKIDGIEAGIVESITLSKGEKYAVVKMGLQNGSYPIGQGASAAIRPVNLLGEKYIQLTPGNTGKPVPSGTTIGLNRTSTPVELDDVFNTLDPTTREALGVLINEAGVGLAGQAGNFQKTLADLPPTVGAAREVVGEIASENGQLRTAITAGNADLKSVDGSRTSLQDLIASGNDAMASINAAGANLGHTVDSAPGGLSQLRATVAQLGAAATALTPASVSLGRTIPTLATTLTRLPGFAADATGALTEARTVAPLLSRLALRSTPVLRQLTPASAALATFATTGQPLMNSLDQGTSLKYMLGFVNGWANSISGKDALGHYFNLNVTLNDSFVQHVLSLDGIGIPALHKSPPGAKASASRHAPAAGRAPAASPQSGAPAAPSGLSSLTAGVQNLGTNAGHTVDGLVSGVTRAVGGQASGGSSAPSGSPADSTSRLLHYLLGN